MQVLAVVPRRRVAVGLAASATVIGVALIASAAGSSRAEATPLEHAVPVATVVEPAVAATPYERAASACPGLDPLLLAAIHDEETRGDATGSMSRAGAVGPMQFMPSTWAAYGTDGNGDGVANVWDLDDALAGATRLLCANGARDAQSEASAVWNYNHSWPYVDAVLARTAALHRDHGE